MSDKLYTIGEFAAINKVSTRMLRHYDKIGILPPSMVAKNGYRMYSSAQITLITLIKKYRACEFSLNEITLLINSNENIPQIAEAKIQELKIQEVLHKDALTRLYELSNTKDSIVFNNPYEISLTQKNSQLLLYGKRHCTEEQIENEFEKLYDFLALVGFNQTGMSMLLSDISTEHGFKVAVPVKQRFETPDYDFTMIDASQYISTIHYGDYYGIACAYDKLILYAGEHGFKRSDLFIERYFLDSTHTTNPNEYITEISIKITP